MNKTQVLVHNEKEKEKNRRFGRGVVIALSRRIIKLHGLLYHVESETVANKFYSVIFKDDAPSSCNCTDYENHKDNKLFVCKHMYALMAALTSNTIVDETDKKEKLTAKSFRDDDYDF